VIGAIYVAIVVVFPPARLAVLLADQVKAATGREFRIDGGLSIRVLPSIAIQARDVVLGNAAWGSRTDMVTVRRAAIDVSPGALLKGELRILRIDIEGVDALLESDGAGRYNWQFTPATAPAAETKPAPQDARAPTSSSSGSSHPTCSSLPRRQVGAAGANDRVSRLAPQRSGSEVTLALAVGKQRLKVEGQVGPGHHPAGGQGGLAVRPATRERRRKGFGQGHRGHGERAERRLPTCRPSSRPRRRLHLSAPMLRGCRCR
jgi:hypothetical protein